jgi:hypothetical protein
VSGNDKKLWFQNRLQWVEQQLQGIQCPVMSATLRKKACIPCSQSDTLVSSVGLWQTPLPSCCSRPLVSAPVQWNCPVECVHDAHVHVLVPVVKDVVCLPRLESRESVGDEQIQTHRFLLVVAASHQRDLGRHSDPQRHDEPRKTRGFPSLTMDAADEIVDGVAAAKDGQTDWITTVVGNRERRSEPSLAS